MAYKIVAINTLRPKVIRANIVNTPKIAKFISGRTTINSGLIKNMLDELYETIVHFNMLGHSVKFDSVGLFYPKMGLDGSISIGFKPDTQLSKEALLEREYTGDIAYPENRGKTADELVALWNEEHPDDLVA